MAAVVNIEDLETRESELKGEIQALDAEYAGQELPGEARERWNEKNTELESTRKLIDELKARSARVAELSHKPENVEEGTFEPFNTHVDRRGDIYDLSTIRSSVANPEGAKGEMVERALTAVDRDAHFPHERADQDQNKAHLERLLRGGGGPDLSRAVLAERILRTGSVLYRRAFSKAVQGRMLTSEEQRAISQAQEFERALAVGTGAASAGLAVPYTLDPTVMLISNGAMNPIRQISRTVQITGLEWRGLTSAGITANRRAEAAEATDNAPTLAQPTRAVSRVDVWIPYSFEAGEDWGALEAEMAREIADAKDVEEATSFTTGNGTLPNPSGLLTGVTNTVNAAAGADAYTLANLYALQGALPPRYLPQAVWMSSLAILNRTRQLDTSAAPGNQIVTPPVVPGGPVQVLGISSYLNSAMPTDATTGNKFLVYGDFSRYVIVDRIGMSLTNVPVVFGTNHIPTGQSGIFAFWRNNALVVDANAFRALLGTA